MLVGAAGRDTVPRVGTGASSPEKGVSGPWNDARGSAPQLKSASMSLRVSDLKTLVSVWMS